MLEKKHKNFVIVLEIIIKMCNNLWGCSGFDLVSDAKLQAEDDGRPPKKTV